MSTATYERPPLYAVPTPEEQQAKFGLLLAIRRRARQALNTLLALPRGAAGWVLRQLRTLLDGVGEHRLLDKAADLLRGVAGLVRGIGVTPIAAAILYPTGVSHRRALGPSGRHRPGRVRPRPLGTREGPPHPQRHRDSHRPGPVQRRHHRRDGGPGRRRAPRRPAGDPRGTRSGRTGSPAQPERGRAPAPRPAHPHGVDKGRRGGPGHAPGYRCRHATDGPPGREVPAGNSVCRIARRTGRTGGGSCRPGYGPRRGPRRAVVSQGGRGRATEPSRAPRPAATRGAGAQVPHPTLTTP